MGRQILNPKHQILNKLKTQNTKPKKTDGAIPGFFGLLLIALRPPTFEPGQYLLLEALLGRLVELLAP